MKANSYLQNNSSRFVFALFLMACFSVAGCSKPKLAAQPPVAPGNSAEKLSAGEVEKRIKAVQDNKSLPESAKPSIIESIRAQGQP